MGNVECTRCLMEKKSCKQCYKNYCLQHDVVRDPAIDRYLILHGRGVPRFGENSMLGLTTFWNKIASQPSICPSPGCTNAGVHTCFDYRCCGLFCEVHERHEHLICQYDTCSFQALDCITVTGKVYCGYHHNIMLNATYSSKYIPEPSYGNCRECKKALKPDRASFHYCATCEGKIHARKEDGIKGAFG